MLTDLARVRPARFLLRPADDLWAVLFAELLGLSEAGVDCRFFDLGGDSNSALQSVTRGPPSGLGFGRGDALRRQSAVELAVVALVMESGGVPGRGGGTVGAHRQSAGREGCLTGLTIRRNGQPQVDRSLEGSGTSAATVW